MQALFVYVSCGESREIDVFSLDSRSGAISLRQRLLTSGSPVPMRAMPVQQRLYVGMRNDNALHAFAIKSDDGCLRSLGGVAAPGAPVYVYSAPASGVVFSSSYGDNNLSVFPLDVCGVPRAAQQTESGLPRAHAARVDQSGRWLLVPTLGADVIRIYRIGTAGRLVPNDPAVVAVKSGSGPRHPVFSADNRFVYCLNELNGCIDVFAFDAERGVLDLRQTISMMPPNFAGAPWAAELRLTGDGRFLYATDRRSSTIATLRVAKKTGKLALVGHTPTEETPRGMDVDPSGRWLVAAGQQSGALTVYAIDPVSGRLAAKGRQRTGKEPICVEIVAP
ncbi:beta-propeller fold lactonase family protein [uncultured Propionivibrio sp.]|uniref:lactonase family protein n=1 Tax=uncultured Propionivibrio sp. TaxID=426737 RepID=UPI0029C09168|nr:beta-propeller fold lactonase family protein [uncultured Propionivibrio sp.]